MAHQRPRRRGRPVGSKTKNRISKESILVPAPIRRPRHYNQVEAAAELGVGHDVLYRLSKTSDPIYTPAQSRGKFVIYTDTQIEIISLVMRGKLTADQGYELWMRIENQEIMDLVRRGRETRNELKEEI